MGFLASGFQPSLYKTRLNQPTTFARKHEAILEHRAECHCLSRYVLAVLKLFTRGITIKQSFKCQTKKTA